LIPRVVEGPIIKANLSLQPQTKAEIVERKPGGGGEDFCDYGKREDH